QYLDAWLDDELDATTRAGIGGHLSSCTGCATLREERERLRETIRAAAPRDPVPAVVMQGVHRAVDRARAAQLTPRPGPTAWQAGALAAAAAFAAAFVAVALMRPTTVEPIVATHVAALARAH